MTTSSLTLTLTAEPHLDRFILSWGMMSYPIEFRPQKDVTLEELLRRLHPLLVEERHLSVEHPYYELLHAVGTRLWQALLPTSAPTEKREELERKLRMDKTPLLLMVPPSLVELPWELLCDPQQSGNVGFLALQRPLVRLIPGGFDVSSFMPPLRVQVLISSSLNLDERQQIDVESERAAIEDAVHGVREAGLLYLQVEDIVTPRRVQQALLRFKPHILHYIGHGGYNEDVGAYLVWEDDHGEAMLIPDTRLADLLRPRGLRAVLLHCCQTANSDTHNEFRNITRTLVDAGIPAVLAQQACFTYPSNQRASEIFYIALTSGLGLAEAIFEVRQTLAQADSLNWAIPILQSTAYGLAPLLSAKAPSSIPDPTLISNSATKDLPAPVSVFVGRQRELRALRAMLNSAPGSGPVMALITGPGGVGKSALVAQAVKRYGGTYKAAITLNFISYQGIELILQQIGEFLMRQGAPELLEHSLPDPKLNTKVKIHETIEALNQTGSFLLLMDNLESVQREDRTLADPNLLLLLQGLLTNLRGGRVLITGRYALEGLLLTDKFMANLLRLDLDDLSSYETHHLLTRHPALAHLSDTVQAELVNEFGGLPYVYELLSSKAASQKMDILIHDVQGRITHERQERTITEWKQVRQQVIEFAALDTTIAHLSEHVRELLARLSVFRRPFPIQALEQGLGATHTDWQTLVDWALLHYDQVDGHYWLHNLVARYAEGLLDEGDRANTQAQLAEWYLHYANSESHDLSDYLEAHRLLREGGDARRASELAMNLANALMRFGLYQLVHNLCIVTIYDASTPNYSEVHLVSEAQYLLGKVAQSQGEYEEARRLYSESLAITERLGDQSGRAATLHQLGNIAQSQGEYEEARRLYSESLAITERLGDQSGRAATLHQLGNIAQSQGEYEEARRLYSEALETFERLGDPRGRAATLGELGLLARQQDDYDAALDYMAQALMIFERLRLPPRYLALRTIAELRAKMGEAAFTSLWQKVTRGQPLPDLPTVNLQQGLPQILITLIQAQDWAESQHILEAHPHLMSAEVDTLLDELAKAQQNEDARGRIEQIRALLARCREVGIAAAFAELPIRQGQRAGDDFTVQRDPEHYITADHPTGGYNEEEKASTVEMQPSQEEIERRDQQRTLELVKQFAFRCAHCGKVTKIVLNLRKTSNVVRGKKSKKIQMLRYCEHCNRPNIIEIPDVWDTSSMDNALLL